jgi:hypothetical protein
MKKLFIIGLFLSALMMLTASQLWVVGEVFTETW